jgi:hypothetical protein
MQPPRRRTAKQTPNAKVHIALRPRAKSLGQTTLRNYVTGLAKAAPVERTSAGIPER